MGIFSKRKFDINNLPMGSLLIDVRTRAEVSIGKIPGSINIPVDEIEKVKEVTSNLDEMIFCVCASGIRAATACKVLKQMGYTKVENIGAVSSFRGELERKM